MDGTDTLRAHLDAGRVTARRRTTTDDLWLAVTWLEQYEADPARDGDVLTSLASAAHYLRAEALRRQARADARAAATPPADPADDAADDDWERMQDEGRFPAWL